MQSSSVAKRVELRISRGAAKTGPAMIISMAPTIDGVKFAVFMLELLLMSLKVPTRVCNPNQLFSGDVDDQKIQKAWGLWGYILLR